MVKRKIPEYAKGCPPGQLVHYSCRGKCQKGRYGQVSITNWQEHPKDDINLYVTCLKCGVETRDHYNWSYKG